MPPLLHPLIKIRRSRPNQRVAAAKAGAQAPTPGMSCARKLLCKGLLDLAVGLEPTTC